MTITLGLVAAMAADLTPVQQLIVDSIRASHQATMKAIMPKHDSTAPAMKMKTDLKMTAATPLGRFHTL